MHDAIGMRRQQRTR